jgi:hypothetical protein
MTRIVLMVVAVVVLGGAIAFFSYQPHKTSTAQVPVQQIPQIDYSTVDLTKSYSNDKYKFSLSMPDTFAARQLPADDSGAATILMESADHSDGVQIMVSPFDEDLHALTADRIHQDVPDLKISEPQPVELGQNYTGLAFKSDNDAFFGASREVWFVLRGNLYQISTYDRLDPLLKKIFATWKFTL